PALSEVRLYTADTDGIVRAFNPDSGVYYWPSPPSVPGITQNLEASPNYLFVVDSFGALNIFVDSGTRADDVSFPVTPSPDGSIFFTTAPVVVQSLRKVYVGRNDGLIQQISTTAWSPEEALDLGVPEGPIFDPSLDFPVDQRQTVIDARA